MRMPRSGEMAPKHVVILGAGFGGLYAARALRRAPVRVTVIDSRNHHLFQPLLYQVATAALNPSDIAAPIRSILRRQKNTTVMLGEARSVDTRRKVVLLSHGEIPYDFLIVATGASHSYFGHEEWAEHAPGLKSIEDALAIRTRVLLAYEAAELEPDPERRREWLTFVIVGAGPTGVELAGALAEISHHTLAHDFRNIDPTQARASSSKDCPASCHPTRRFFPRRPGNSWPVWASRYEPAPASRTSTRTAFPLATNGSPRVLSCGAPAWRQRPG